MKNFARIAGLIVLAALVVLPAAAGGKSARSAGTTQSGGGTAQPSPATGSLTITGLDDYNGWYMYAIGYNDGWYEDRTTVYAAVDVGQSMMERGTEYTGALIRNGSVTVPVWLIEAFMEEYDPDDPPFPEKTAYSGSDTVTLEVTLWGTGHDSIWSATIHWIDELQVEAVYGVPFTDGKAAFDWNQHQAQERIQEK